MKLVEIYIAGFRNLRDVRYSPSGKLNALFGQNAQGKTNFLEALYVALRGRSFRYYSSKKDWLPAQGSLAVSAVLQTDLGNRHTVELRGDEKGLKFIFDEKRIAAAQIKRKHPIVVFSPDDHTLIRGDPLVRRQFGEDVLSDGVPGFAEVLDDYEKSLKNKNALLKQIRDEGPNIELRNQNNHWDFLLAKNALKLLDLRAESWPAYSTIFHRVIGEIFHTRDVDMSWRTFAGPLTVETYVDNLRKNFERDLATGWTHFGVHRDDIEIVASGIPARSSASQGQARMLAMALRWSHAEWIRERSFEEPLFFVDDFSSELDERHREALLRRLLLSSGQVFLTGTNDSFLDPKLLANSSKAYIVNGRILEPEGEPTSTL